MASAAGTPHDASRERPLVERRPRRTVRGVNLLAELEALCVLGAGRFEVGVSYALNVFRGVPLAEHSGEVVESPFAGRRDARHWARPVYADDAYLLDRMGSSTSVALAHALGVAWPHVPAPYRERFEARLAELPDDGLARAWSAAGGARWWEPPRTEGEQLHFVADAGEAFHGIPR